MKNWLRSMLAVAALSIPAVGCAMQAGPDADGYESTTEQAAQKATPQLAKLSEASVDGKFSRWLVTPHGKIGGMLLEDGSVVRVHGRALKETNLAAGDVVHVEGKTLAVEGAQPVYLMASVKKGDTVIADAPKFEGKHWKHADGVKPSAEQIEAWKKQKAEGKAFQKPEGWKKHKAAEGKAFQKPEGWKKHKGEGKKAEKPEGWKKHGKHDLSSLAALSSKGTIEAIVAGHHGKPHALVLSDGTVAYAPFKSDLAALGLKKGDAISVSGKGGEYPLGRALFIESVQLANGEVKTF